MRHETTWKHGSALPAISGQAASAGETPWLWLSRHALGSIGINWDPATAKVSLNAVVEHVYFVAALQRHLSSSGYLQQGCATCQEAQIAFQKIEANTTVSSLKSKGHLWNVVASWMCEWQIFSTCVMLTGQCEENCIRRNLDLCKSWQSQRQASEKPAWCGRYSDRWEHTLGQRAFVQKAISGFACQAHWCFVSWCYVIKIHFKQAVAVAQEFKTTITLHGLENSPLNYANTKHKWTRSFTKYLFFIVHSFKLISLFKLQMQVNYSDDKKMLN